MFNVITTGLVFVMQNGFKIHYILWRLGNLIFIFFNIMIESNDIISSLALCCVFLRQVNLLLLVPVQLNWSECVCSAQICNATMQWFNPLIYYKGICVMSWHLSFLLFAPYVRFHILVTLYVLAW